jgi:hypothetical protein
MATWIPEPSTPKPLLIYEPVLFELNNGPSSADPCNRVLVFVVVILGSPKAGYQWGTAKK